MKTKVFVIVCLHICHKNCVYVYVVFKVIEFYDCFGVVCVLVQFLPWLHHG